MHRSIFAPIRTRFDAFDDRLDAWAARHRAELRALGIASCFALLFCAVALHVTESGLAGVAAARCGPICADVPGFEYIAAAACGAAAILFLDLYARLTAAVQRVFIDPLVHVRPAPPPPQAPRLVRALHVVIGLALFLLIAALGKTWTPGVFDGLFDMSVETPNSSTVHLGSRALLALFLGWWIGGRGVLNFFWRRQPRGGGFALGRPGA